MYVRVAKASAKRFRVTGTGKIVRRCAGKQHLLSKKNAKRRKRLSKMVTKRFLQFAAHIYVFSLPV
jgi:ribosomal protein L35